MALQLTKKSDTELSVDFSNGHLEALKKIALDYRLKSEQEALTFMLGVLSQANGQPIEINGTKFVPSEGLRKIE